MKANNKKSTRSKSSSSKAQIESLKTELKNENDKYLRLFAEFENFRKRTTKERIELYKTASSELMCALLPVTDDMDRALIEFKKSKNEELIKGYELILNKFTDILKSNGLVRIVVNNGDVFDADKHEAITQIKAPNKKMTGKIVDVIESGYMIGDKILRYPKVVVAN